MDVGETLRRIGETMHVRQVFGEPVRHEGTLVIPVASVWGLGGTGGGSGNHDGSDSGMAPPTSTPDAEQEQTGRGAHGRRTGGEAGGGGLVNRTRALGVYTVGADGMTQWHPVVDVTRIALVSPVVLGTQAVAVVAILAGRSLLRRRPRLPRG